MVVARRRFQADRVARPFTTHLNLPIAVTPLTGKICWRKVRRDTCGKSSETGLANSACQKSRNIFIFKITPPPITFNTHICAKKHQRIRCRYCRIWERAAIAGGLPALARTVPAVSLLEAGGYYDPAHYPAQCLRIATPRANTVRPRRFSMRPG